MNRLQRIEKSLISQADPVAFDVGDTVRVHVKVIEGGKERIQVFEGVVIAKSGGANREAFTIRKVSYNTGVERVFPMQSPKIAKLEVVRRGRVRRAKLFYLRERRGKSARIAERDMRGKNAAKARAAKAAPVVEEVIEPVEETVETPVEAVTTEEAVAVETAAAETAAETPEAETVVETTEEVVVAEVADEATDEPAEDAKSKSPA